MLRNWSGGVGDDNVPCTCTHVGCYATGLGWGVRITFLALAHMLDATQLVWGGGDDNVPCICTHVGCTQVETARAASKIAGTQCVDRLWQSLKRF